MQQEITIQNGNSFTDAQGQRWLSLPFKKKKEDKRDIAVIYFQLLSAFNGLKLSEGEIKLLAHIALNGGIVSGSCKIRFAEKFDSSIPAIDNTISKLKRKKILEKKNNIVTLNSKINIDFSNNNNFIFSFKCVLNG